MRIQNFVTTLLLDSYKLSHQKQYPIGTSLVYSNLTSRSSNHCYNIDSHVFCGLQYFIKEYLVNQFNENFFGRKKDDVISEMKRVTEAHFGEAINTSHFEALHDLGYLPIKIKALPEGSRVPIRTPSMTIYNTHADFGWLTNSLETLLSDIVWKPIVSATIADLYRKKFEEYAEKTGASKEFIDFQGHDFSMRGMVGVEGACLSAFGHVTAFKGSDTVPVLMFAEEYYNAPIEDVAYSVPATEHSVQCLHGVQGGVVDEDQYVEHMLDTYSNGIVSVVSDGFDYWKMVTETLPKFKDRIMARDGKYVVRPDSGNPVDIICGEDIQDITEECKGYNLDELADACKEIVLEQIREETDHGEYGGDKTVKFKCCDKYYECYVEPNWNRYDKQYYYIDGIWKKELKEIELTPEQKGSIQILWDTFGGTTNGKGYKTLDSHIGLIYGDAITLERQEEILKRLEAKGFASDNIVLGIGSFTYNCNTRDTLGLAVKATYGEVTIEGKVESRPIFKQPKTDSGMKNSARGLLRVNEDLTLTDECTWEEEDKGLLTTVFEDGKLVKETSLKEIRERLSA